MGSVQVTRCALGQYPNGESTCLMRPCEPTAGTKTEDAEQELAGRQLADADD